MPDLRPTTADRRSPALPTPARPMPARPSPPRAFVRLAVLVLLSLLSLAATAQTRAWLDRDRIGLGETVTLNIETTADSAPDYSPLEQDFTISGRSSRRQFELANGRSRTRTLYAVALRPQAEGVLTIPALRVGNQSTQPLALVVTPASQAPARAGDDVFLESEADDGDPYVQQSVGWVVRLYSAVPLVSGQLDQPAPEGASLRKVGDDAQYTRTIGGRQYQVIERRYLLIPERSGPLTVPGAHFEGRGAAGFFDDFFGRGGGALQASSAPRTLQVRPIPDGATQPWLPLHDLQLRYTATPQALRVGSAASVTIEAVADGATAAQMPELELPPIDGVQVFADPVQADESFVDGRPRVKLTRKFSLVPSQAGAVTLPGLRLGWWDVGANRARTARLPPLQWQVAGGSPNAAAAAGPAPATTPQPAGTAPVSTADGGGNRVWIAVAVLFAALWLLTLLWALQRRAAAPTPAGGAAPAAVRKPADPAVLRRALDTGALGDVADALCALADPPARDVDELRARLSDPAQREAVDAMQRARWGDGDGTAARAQLRSAFAGGPRWLGSGRKAESPLPPLYPDRPR